MIRCEDKYSFLEPRLNQQLSSMGTPPIFPPDFIHSMMIGINEILVARGIREKTAGFQTEIPAKSNSPPWPDPSAPSRSTIRPLSRHQRMLVEKPVVRSANVTSLNFEQCSSTRRSTGKSVRISPLYTIKASSPI